MQFTALPVLLLAAAGSCLAKPHPTAPALTYLYTANITTTAQISMGQTPSGTQTAQGIAGGSFEGPKLKGETHVSSYSSLDCS